MTGHLCPECGTPRDAEGRAGPGCVCADRVADAVQAERGAEVAAAEDFDPLRVRPYVTLQNVAESGAAPDRATARGRVAMPDRGTVPGAVPGAVPDGATVPLPLAHAVDPAQHAVDPAQHDEPATLAPLDLTPVRRSRHSRRRRPYKGLMVVAAAVTVAGTAAFAGGLFSGDDKRERALPDRETGAPTVSALPDAPTASPGRSGSATADSSASPTGTASAEQSPSRKSPGSSATAGPSTPLSTLRATGSVSEAPPVPGSGTLRSGDSGPAVVELQQRLAKVLLYGGPMDGEYDGSVEDSVRFFQDSRDVKGDPAGVYGPKTRRALEAETQ
ncbi:peptidoglycan-binding protein [Streptomyces lunaelactis]|uniref:peptidoglycan-binding protein n=1 Tax=Streptomyces lunaelactis TaxID=1535768 RepID=UPI0015851853|nr:peptidoglycan-binding protein [Streptomyces lunaelactis]NUK11048.1 peptidoglycan-binding protein [Streptomyces lunaelactis]NUK19680.1 peptidoglycan-binding protein [Streptomyces lunaelactis]NUK66527.1 peptidoglycan-binding protein [Streptomyces lunaelactis]NUK79317.1 peptidoglycan-binding protein [Streptomyces lunaelactis]NUK96585.1 peptidoglycan-binding protein [Streptomyces lunaelactis]